MTQHLRDFYEILGECGLPRQPWEAWLAYATENAELWPLMKDGKMIGGAFFKGQTVHIAVLPQWQGRWITKTLLRAYKQWTHECEIVAHPAVENTKARALAERLGFKYTGTTPNGLFALYVKEPVLCLQS